MVRNPHLRPDQVFRFASPPYSPIGTHGGFARPPAAGGARWGGAFRRGVFAVSRCHTPNKPQPRPRSAELHPRQRAPMTLPSALPERPRISTPDRARANLSSEIANSARTECAARTASTPREEVDHSRSVGLILLGVHRVWIWGDPEGTEWCGSEVFVGTWGAVEAGSGADTQL